MNGIELLLPYVSKPTRYLGNEINSIHKDPSSCKIKVCLAFPDLYEIGMSHLGLKILYKVINDIPYALAHRVYAPSEDMAELMIREGIPLLSLEGGIPVREFDILGFTVQHELLYTNILWMLQLAGIPLRSKDRKRDEPLIVAGGPCCVNPEPLAPFIDLFCIGDGEGFVRDLVDCVFQNKGKDRDALLLEVAKIRGAYVPSFYEDRYEEQGRFIAIVRKDGSLPLEVRSRVEGDLDLLPFPTSQIIPFMQIVHDRATLEAQRGCTQGCRFCQVGMTYRPMRERSIECLKDQISKVVASTGYEEISLCGLSLSDYDGIEELALWFIKEFGDLGVALSLPSLRPDGRALRIARLLSKIKGMGLTIAPEAGSLRLRNVINKRFDEESFLDNIRRCFEEGFRLIKLYFMIGLPTEREDDLDGIVDLVKRIEGLIVGKGKVKVSISPFVPKPHTPFQWEPQLDLEILRNRGRYLIRRLRKGRIMVGMHDPKMSLLEAVLAKGDRRLSGVIEEAFLLGARFDSWRDRFRFDLWEEAFKKRGLDPSFYANRRLDPKDPLPWDHIRIGPTKEYLLSEYLKAYHEESTEDCRSWGCRGCGACDGIVGKKRQGVGMDEKVLRLNRPSKKSQRYKVRVQFSKKGAIKYISQLDMVHLFGRAMRRAGIPVAFSCGYSPHPRLSFGPPLPVGMEGEDEYLDIGLSSWIDLPDIEERLNGVLPPGIEVKRACFIPNNADSLFSIIDLSIYRAILKGDGSFSPKEKIIAFLRDNRDGDIKGIEAIVEEDGIFTIELSLIGIGKRVREIIAKIFPSCEVLRIERVGQFHIDRERGPISPLEMGLRRRDWV